MGKKTQQCLFFVLCLSGLIRCSAAMVIQMAVVEIIYLDSNNETMYKQCECGVYGRDSPMEGTSGIVALPVGDARGCGPYPVYNVSVKPWIALVKRGNCTFTEKINAARRQGAAGVVVYNEDGRGNSTAQMAHPETEDIVAVMIGNTQGMEVVRLVDNGTEVRMIIELGRTHGPWIDTYWLYFLSIAFFIVTVASITYFVCISATRLYHLNAHKRSERRLKSEAKKAIGRLQVRTLKGGDEETLSDIHMCAVCIESYKVGDVVTVLTCDHIFHKPCIEPWLLEKRTCPMCKCDILKALGVEEEMKENVSVVLPADATIITVAGGEPLYEVPLTDTERANPERHQHRYDNRAFEEDAEAVRG